MKWRIKGADAHTGKKRKLEVEADDEKSAVEEAKKQAVFAYQVVKVPDPPPPPVTAPAAKPQPTASSPPPSSTAAVCCPACGSQQVTAQKRGYGTGAGAAGCLLLGPLGLLGGAIGSNKIIITCLSCGNEFEPGQGG